MIIVLKCNNVNTFWRIKCIITSILLRFYTEFEEYVKNSHFLTKSNSVIGELRVKVLFVVLVPSDHVLDCFTCF